MSSNFERTGSTTVYAGYQATIYKRHFRHEDGEEVVREVVGHPGAVAVVAHDGTDIWLVAQPREAVEQPDMLELPAGKRDVEGEPPLETAKRELAEEIGKGASTWEPLISFHSSPGFSDEEVHIFLATDLHDESAEVEENERIDIVRHPLAQLDELLKLTTDAKTLIGLYELRRRLHG
ncbi:MAG: NUDIX hydrolase [Solirubrobacterales bacterium]|nr:NUDIX hydrolase [Solirubrobacterales bacterium]